MDSFWSNVQAGMVANLLFTFLTIIPGLLIWFVGFGIRGTKFNKFFGINRSNKISFKEDIQKEHYEINIFISTLKIDPKLLASNDCWQMQSNKNQEEIFTISVGEFDLIPMISNEISRKKILSPKKLTWIFDNILNLAKPIIKFNYSSKIDTESLPKTSIICIGSPLYNEITRYYLDNNKLPVKFDLNPNIIIKYTTVQNVKEKKNDDDFVEPLKEEGKDVAMLVKFHEKDNDRNNVVFVAAGTGVNGTKAATYYLIAFWDKLKKRHGESNFFEIITVDSENSTNKPDEYTNFKIIHMERFD
jgi:hypothetical protein